MLTQMKKRFYAIKESVRNFLVSAGRGIKKFSIHGLDAFIALTMMAGGAAVFAVVGSAVGAALITLITSVLSAAAAAIASVAIAVGLVGFVASRFLSKSNQEKSFLSGEAIQNLAIASVALVLSGAFGLGLGLQLIHLSSQIALMVGGAIVGSAGVLVGGNLAWQQCGRFARWCGLESYWGPYAEKNKAVEWTEDLDRVEGTEKKAIEEGKLVAVVEEPRLLSLKEALCNMQEAFRQFQSKRASDVQLLPDWLETPARSQEGFEKNSHDDNVRKLNPFDENEQAGAEEECLRKNGVVDQKESPIFSDDGFSGEGTAIKSGWNTIFDNDDHRYSGVMDSRP